MGVTLAQAKTADIGFVHLRTGRDAGATLRRGFTTVQEVGGPAFGPKQAMDAGALAGLLVLDADPAAGLDTPATSDTRIAVIVKDGQIVTARI